MSRRILTDSRLAAGNRSLLTGAGCLVVARHLDTDGCCLESEVAYLFLPVGHSVRKGRFGRRWCTPVQSRRVLLGVDGYWEITVPPEGASAAVPEKFKISMSLDKQFALDDFIDWAAG